MSKATRWASRGAALLAFALLASPLPTAGQSAAPAQRSAPDDPSWQLPLEGTTWRLRDYVYRGVQRQSGPEVAAWMTLRAGRLEGSGGCTRLRGRYGVMGQALRVTLRKPRRGDCVEQTTLVQMGLTEGLRDARSYDVQSPGESSGDELSLRDAAGDVVLSFVADDVSDPASGEWQLAAWTADGERVEAESSQPAVLAFRPVRGPQARRASVRRESSGEAVGSTGCNGLVGPYFRHADVMSFGQLELTDAPCSAALAAQEAAIVAVLDSTSQTLELPPDRLVLSAAESGDSLEYVAAAPLEGSTWQLARLRGATLPEQPVTLRLDAGVASGIGPCGTYRGSYQTDGRFIAFGDLRGGPSDGCPDEAIERTLLEALEFGVLLERDHPRLRLLDARGRLTAGFRHAGAP